MSVVGEMDRREARPQLARASQGNGQREKTTQKRGGADAKDDSMLTFDDAIHRFFFNLLDLLNLLTTSSQQDKLIDPTSVSHLHRITKTLGMLATGAPADARSIVQKARAEAADYR